MSALSSFMTFASRLGRLGLTVTLAAAAAVVATAQPAQAASYTFTVTSPVVGRIGIDAIYQGGGGGGIYDIATCSNTGQPTLGWNAAGQLEGTTTIPDTAAGLGALTQTRFEMYPGPCGTYNGWDTTTGGVHFDATPTARNLGNIVMPTLGNPGVFRITGGIIAPTAVTDGRVKVDSFQIPTGYPDPPAPLQTNGIVSYGAFASTSSRNGQWTAGPGWAGRYILFVTDTATGRNVAALTDIGAANIPTIDLGAPCFGFNVCTESAAAGPRTGRFHPTDPSRILDTRNGIGIANGPIRTGMGAHPSLDPITRIGEAVNHELKVTGRNGIPETGVSAVLLNVTAVDAPAASFLSVVPKTARVGDIFNDQDSLRFNPTTSNLNVTVGPQATPNLVLVPVGAGGIIRIFNSAGPTHLIADLAGWYGTETTYTSGSGFTGVDPQRALDTRNGIGGPAIRFAAGETRTVEVANRFGVPADAQSVVVNITTTAADGFGYVTAFPDGTARPNASNNNYSAGAGARANTSVVKVGVNGKIALTASEAGTDVIVDVLGAYSPSGADVTTISPTRVADTRTGAGTAQGPVGTNTTRTIAVAGRNGIPADAKAVIVNITAVEPTAWGFLTVWPAGQARPDTSNLNFAPGQTTPNLAMLKLGAGGALDVFNEAGASHVLFDVVGYTR